MIFKYISAKVRYTERILKSADKTWSAKTRQASNRSRHVDQYDLKQKVCDIRVNFARARVSRLHHGSIVPIAESVVVVTSPIEHGLVCSSGLEIEKGNQTKRDLTTHDDVWSPDFGDM